MQSVPVNSSMFVLAGLERETSVMAAKRQGNTYQNKSKMPFYAFILWIRRLTEVNEGICDFLIVGNNEKEIFRKADLRMRIPLCE